MQPSAEQQTILDTIADGYNVVGDCVAGSGKTTSVLMIAERFPDKQIVQITYNSQLKSEVRQKVEERGFSNLEIHTYHSLVVRYYDRRGHDDAVIRRVVESDTAPVVRLPRVDILIVDEAQDMTFLYYRLVRKFQRDVSVRCFPQIVILGDKYQGIYKFKDADPRYLTCAHALWDIPGQEQANFIPVGLTTSYRVSSQIAEFVNTCMLQARRIRSSRTGPPVQYYRLNIFSAAKRMRDLILSAIAAGSVRPEDIFVLGGSIRSDSSPMRKLENALVEAQIPCYFPTSDDTRLDKEVVEGKVVFSTFHQAKGRERKMVIVYGFDNSYFKYFGKDYDPMQCPETLYVAATRARDQLILLENAEEGPLPFLTLPEYPVPFLHVHEHSQQQKQQKQQKDTDAFSVIQSQLDLSAFGFLVPATTASAAAAAAATTATKKPQQQKQQKQQKQQEQHRTSVSELTRFLNEHNLNILINLLNEIYEEEVAELYDIQIPTKVSFGEKCVEDVSDINGIVIPAMYEARLCARSTVEIDVRNRLSEITANDSYKYVQEACRKLPRTPQTPSEYCYLTMIYIAMTERIYHKLEQIKECRWLTAEMVEACFVGLDTHLTSDTIFEQSICDPCEEFSAEYGCVEISGRMDAVSDDCVWEFKCTDSLSVEHMLQLAVYAYAWRRVYEEEHGTRIFRLMNLRTGQVMRMKPNAGRHLSEIVHVLFHNKFAKQTALSDAEFIDRCRTSRNAITNAITNTKKSNTHATACMIE